MRRERRGGDADAEAPQAFKEGASTLRNAQNRTHISCSAAAWEVMGVGIGFHYWGRKKKGPPIIRQASSGQVQRFVRFGYYVPQL